MVSAKTNKLVKDYFVEHGVPDIKFRLYDTQDKEFPDKTWIIVEFETKDDYYNYIDCDKGNWPPFRFYTYIL